MDTASVSFNHVPSDNLIFKPVASLDQDIRPERGNNAKRIRFVEDRYEIHTGQGGQKLSALHLWEDGSSGRFDKPDRPVAVDSHHQAVSVSTCPLEIPQMADMKQIKTAIGKDDSLFLFSEAVEDGSELANALDLFLLGRISMGRRFGHRERARFRIFRRGRGAAFRDE